MQTLNDASDLVANKRLGLILVTLLADFLLPRFFGLARVTHCPQPLRFQLFQLIRHQFIIRRRDALVKAIPIAVDISDSPAPITVLGGSVVIFEPAKPFT